MDNNSDSKDTEESEEHGGENIYCLPEYLNHGKETVGRNMDQEKDIRNQRKGNEKNVIGNWREGNPCYVMAENLTELCVLQWKCREKDW